MKEIILTQGKVALVDDEDFERLNKHKWYCRNGYAVRMTKFSLGKRQAILMHREIISPPQGLVVDHINGDGLDNRKKNLRACTHAENIRNQKLNRLNTTGYKGVCVNSKKWIARIKINGKLLYLGRYNTPEEAAQVYDEAARKYFGKFAKVNF